MDALVGALSCAVLAVVLRALAVHVWPALVHQDLMRRLNADHSLSPWPRPGRAYRPNRRREVGLPVSSGASGWSDWCCRELMALTGTRSLTAAQETLSTRYGPRALADPMVWSMGGMFGVVVIAAESAEAAGARDERLTALAAYILMDPHDRGVARAVADARRQVVHRAPFWEGK